MEEKYALLSVYRKEGIVEFARKLQANGYKILSSGGTALELKRNSVEVTDVSEYIDYPEIMNGRVKTLHPRIHGGILMERNNPKHITDAKKKDIYPIDIVAVNLYPFEETVARKPSMEEAIENVDIGGPTMLRAAAKNFKHVAAVCDPSGYKAVIADLEKNGSVSLELRKKLAVAAWEHIAHYDVIIEQYFREKLADAFAYPEYLNMSFKKRQDLRYGENPHQTAAAYYAQNSKNISVLDAQQFQGKQLSYNNVLDLNSAYRLLMQFDEPTAIIVKHNNPCGVASARNLLDAYKTARAVDPEAAFGGIVTVNRKVTKELAKEIITRFVEIVLAPEYDQEALQVFTEKKNIRVMQLPITTKSAAYRTYRSVTGGLLVQDNDSDYHTELKVVTKRKPSEEEMKAMIYAWKIVKYVRSNAIIYARSDRAVGIGAGQMKRIDAAKIGAEIAGEFNESLKGCAMASDAFFPFRDGIDYAAKLGVTAIIQPGGSVKDSDVIAAANEHNITMVFTGMRHFRH
jgi:phosphoribosylaminoimidazolecarboxamide formyltransferase/IMP cyclohydrolase